MPSCVIDPISNIKTPIREFNCLLPDFQILKRKLLLCPTRRSDICHVSALRSDHELSATSDEQL